MEAFTVERRNRIAAEAARGVRRTFRYLANAHGECDTCHREPMAVYREDSDEGWQECEDCSAAREGRKAVKAAMRKAGR